MSEEKIHEEYFRLTTEYKTKYGDRIALLMQVGAFFEIYGHKIGDALPTKSNIVEIAQICGGLAIADKKVAYQGGQIVMAGFRDYNLDKYLPFLMDAGYTVVVYIQEQSSSKKGMNRVLHSIYSPGTYLTGDLQSGVGASTSASGTQNITNYIMCIWMEKYMPLAMKTTSNVSGILREKLVCGMAAANILTGKSFMFEYETPFAMTPTTFDELERWLSIFAPSEIVFIGPFDETVERKILNYAGCGQTTLHLYDTNKPIESIENCMKPVYIRHLLSTFYGEETVDVCSEFTTWPTATQAFCYLMHFIQEHNPNLVKQIAKPIFQNTSSRMVLANHTLKQLNIVNDGSPNAGLYSSVASFLNRCCTPLGRRLFYSQITNPVCDRGWLTREYEITALLLEEDAWPMIEMFRRQLRNLVDLEKVGRQIIARKVVPSSIYRLYQSLLDIQQIHVCLFEQTDLCNYLFGDGGEAAVKEDVHAKMEKSIMYLLEKIYSTLVVEDCAAVNTLKIERNIIKSGVSRELDELLKTHDELESMFMCIKTTLNRMIAPNDDTEFIRIHETEKMGQTLQITKTRGVALRKILGSSGGGNKIVFSSTDMKKHTTETVPVADIKFKAAGGTYEEIEFPLLTNILYKKSAIKEQIQNRVSIEYMKFIESMEIESLLHLETISRYIAKLDVIQSKTFVAAKFNYCRPRLVLAQDQDPNENEENRRHSFFAAKKMRHCLIEHIQTNETYVANDVSMGASGAPNGILLYGTNAVGKTSLIRAIGICIIMAQAGMYVPCAEFTYSPYNAIYTRILGNDNMFKNLSTFAVEMSELRVILNNADSKSLVLGDELCSGTETESALSIFMAGLATLSRLGASFIFATHFHEIAKFEELKNLSNVVSKHMSVYYDREHDCLVYDRILKDGAGDKMYGLEVAKSLHLPDDFIEMAYAIRTKYFPVGGELSGVATRYNAKKIRGVCELCGEEMATETHHILEQANADARGYVDGIHKNHPANLVGLCSKCHDLQHHGVAAQAANPASPSIVIKLKKKTTAGYKRI